MNTHILRRGVVYYQLREGDDVTLGQFIAESDRHAIRIAPRILLSLLCLSKEKTRRIVELYRVCALLAHRRNKEERKIKIVNGKSITIQGGTNRKQRFLGIL